MARALHSLTEQERKTQEEEAVDGTMGQKTREEQEGREEKEMGERTPLEETKGQSLKLPEKPSVLQLGKVFT